MRRIIVVISIVLAWTGIAPAYQAPQIPVTELLTIGDEATALIYQWVGLATDPQGYIYITDLKDFSLKKFDPRGKLLKSTGSRGQGPGEFQGPGKIRYHQGLLYVAEIQHPGIQIFDTGLALQAKIPLKTPLTDFQVLNNSTLAVTLLNSQAIMICDLHGRLVKKIRYTDSSSIMLQAVNLCRYQHDYYLGFKWQDRVSKLSASGELIWSRTLLKGGSSPLRRLHNIQVPRQIIYKTIATDSRGTIFILGGDWSAHPSRNIYLLSPQGDRIGDITLPEPTHTFHIDQEDNLFVRSDYGTRIKKYRIERYD